MHRVILDGASLTPRALAQIADGASVTLADEARLRMDEAAAWYATQASDAVRSKVAWLVGAESDADPLDVVKPFVLGHCAAVGKPLGPRVVRAMLAARLNVLATGHTGCRSAVADTFIAMLDAHVLPVVPSQGSVGAAGVAQLAHIVRVACGYGGEAWRDGVRMPCAQAMAGIPFMDPNEKEVLSLINGATYSAALAALVVDRANTLMATAEAACALSFEVVRADLDCLSERALAARRHPGAVAVAARLRERLAGSDIVTHGRRPDPFSIRCAPAVLGAAVDALAHIEQTVTRELNGACDNPLVFAPDGVVEAGNFHGAPVAMAMDHLKVALVQVASISERRIFRMTYGQLSGLPSFLVPGTGLNSGLMLAQYTAASLVSECKGLAHPASVDNIPTVQHREDHVSMGPIAGRGAWAIAEALADVLAIELMCGAQGLDFHLAGESVDEAGALVSVEPSCPGAGTRATYDAVRAHVARWTDDRVLHPDLVALGAVVRAGGFV